MWESFDIGTSCKGNTVEGDTTVPPTRWWNRWWLAWRVWDTVAVFEVKTDKAFRVGYRVGKGKAYITVKPLNTSAKHGYIAESEMRDNGEPLRPVAGPSPRPRPVGHTATRRWPHVRVLVGFEDCTFFAVDKDGNEVPLTLIKRVARKDTHRNDGTRLY